MTGFKRGEVVLVPFPFTDQTTAKKRPAVIISSDTYNDISSDLIIVIRIEYGVPGIKRGAMGSM